MSKDFGSWEQKIKVCLERGEADLSELPWISVFSDSSLEQVLNTARELTQSQNLDSANYKVVASEGISRKFIHDGKISDDFWFYNSLSQEEKRACWVFWTKEDADISTQELISTFDIHMFNNQKEVVNLYLTKVKGAPEKIVPPIVNELSEFINFESYIKNRIKVSDFKVIAEEDSSIYVFSRKNLL